MSAAAAKTVAAVEETVAKLGALAHVVEVKAPWALVHASPASVARIVSELRLPVHPAKRGGDYYAVKVAETAPVRHLSVATAPAAPAPKAAPKAAPVASGNCRLEIKGADYVAKETRPKRSQDVRRIEVRKLGDELGKPYVVSFQSEDGDEAQCSCPDSIYRRRRCKHITAVVEAFVTSTTTVEKVA